LKKQLSILAIDYNCIRYNT